MNGESATEVDQKERAAESGQADRVLPSAVTAPPPRRRAGWHEAVLGVLLLAFLALRILVLTRGDVTVVPDTQSYEYRDGRGFDSGPLVSFTGHAPRLWGTPLFYHLFQNDTARTVAQWTLGTIAWALLAWVVWYRLRTLSVRVLAALCILTLALLPEVTSWDFALLSESLSISLGVLSLALLIWWLATKYRTVLVALVVAAFYWIFIRPEMRVMVVFVALALAVRAVRRREQRWPAAVAAAVLIAGMGWVTLITPTMSQTFADRSSNGLNLEQGTLTYRLRFNVMPDPDTLAVYEKELGMPHCRAAVAEARLSGWRMAAFIQAYQSCPDLVAWGEQNAISANLRFALAAPHLYYDQTVRDLPKELGGGVRSNGTGVLPHQVDRFFFVPQHLVLPGLGGCLIGALALGLAVMFAGLAGPRRQRLVLLAGFGAALVSMVSALVDLTLTAGGVDRFGIQEAIGVRVALILMLVAGLDAVFRPVRWRRIRDSNS